MNEHVIVYRMKKVLVLTKFLIIKSRSYIIPKRLDIVLKSVFIVVNPEIYRMTVMSI